MFCRVLSSRRDIRELTPWPCFYQREAFVTRLARHSDAGRLHAQEAVLPKKRTKDPDAMLSLPEFIREEHEAPLRDPQI